MNPKLTLKRWLFLAVVTMVLAMTPAWTGHGQAAPRERLARSGEPTVRVVQPPAAPTGASTTVGPAAQPVLYIALVRTAPKVSIQFAASTDSNGDPVNPTTTFTFGLKTLYYFVTIIGAQGYAYREEWTINGDREPQLDFSSTIPSDGIRYSDAIIYPSGKSLDRGTYQLNIFLNNALYTQSTAVIR